MLTPSDQNPLHRGDLMNHPSAPEQNVLAKTRAIKPGSVSNSSPGGRG